MNVRSLLAAFSATLVVALGAVLIETADLDRAVDAQRDAFAAELEVASSRVTRDLTQQVSIAGGVAALASDAEPPKQEAFAAFVGAHLRENPSLRRIFVVRDGRVAAIAPYTSVPATLERIEGRLQSSDPIVARAVARNVPALTGPVPAADGRLVFVYARPVFLNNDPTGAHRGFAGMTIEVDEGLLCRLGQCEPRPKQRMALRAVVDQQPQGWTKGDQALFSPQAGAVTSAVRMPGVRFDVAAVPAAGWIAQAPNRWLIRAVALMLALSGGMAAYLVAGGRGGLVKDRSLAIVGAAGVFLLVAGAAALVERTRSAAGVDEAKDRATAELALLASRATRDLTEALGLLGNLSAFVVARPSFSDAEFHDFAARLRRDHPDLLSVRLARDGKVSHVEPKGSIDPALMGSDLTRGAAEAALSAASINTGTPVLSGPFRLPGGEEAFLYRRPVFLGDGAPSRDRFWGFATVLIERRAVLCKLGLCEQPARFRAAARLVVNQEPRPAFEGDDALFDAGSDAVRTAIRVPGARVEIAAVPVEGWGETGRRWLLWAIAIPAALAAAGGLLTLFLSLSTAVLNIWLGGLGVLVGLLLTLFHAELTAGLAATGFGLERVVGPARLTFIALALAFAANSALAAYVWPPRDRSGDAMTRAPAILRSFVTAALYGLALLWAAAFAFGLSLEGVGLTSGVLGIVVGIAVQRIILDFFSGVMIGVERPFRIGDWIEINGGAVRGTVTEMTWRTTTIRTSTPDHVLVPNSTLAQSLIVNRSRPTPASDAAIAVVVDAGVPFETVQAVLLSAAETVRGTVPNVLSEPPPSVSVTDLKDGLATYRLSVAVAFGESGDGKARAELFRATQLAFASAGIAYGWSRSETRSVGEPADAARAASSEAAEAPQPTLSQAAA